MKTNSLTIFTLFVICYIRWVTAACNDNQTRPSVPVSKNEDYWMNQHTQFKENTAANPNITAIFYGDSITAAWKGNGLTAFNEFYAPLGVANYGINGDQTQHVLWRILNGEVDGLNPKVVVLLIGTNNLGGGSDSDCAITEGILNIVTTLRKKLPNTKILLLGVLPRGDIKKFDSIMEINSKIVGAADGKKVFYLDMFDLFKGDTPGEVPESLFYDKLHLTTAGYQLWAQTMNPLFNRLME